MLVLVGVILGALPLVAILGFLLIIIGAILVILGRKAFGPQHARNVMISIVIFFVGIIIAIAAVFILVGALTSASLTNPTAAAESVRVAFNNFLILLVVASAVSGVAYVLFTYAIQNRMGRMILFIAYGASVAIQVIVYAVISPAVSDAVSQSVASGRFDSTPLVNLQARTQTLSLLGIISSALYALAYYLVWSRVSHGEIPAPPTPPAAGTPSSRPGGGP